ncbi:MAG: hypothetical protein ACO3JG_12190 [Luteolibacter sp.]
MIDFFNSWWCELAGRGWEAVVLHSWQELPQNIESDIDYAVRGPKPPELLRLLAGHARHHGWRLVQVIEHEPDAFFCVCQQATPPFDSLQLDVAWSYRRLGHSLVPGELLFENHRAAAGKAFRVPSPGSEFTYLLAKAAAKGKEFGKIRERATSLLAEDPEGCREIASKAFGNTLESGASIMDWEIWFASAPAFGPIRHGRRFGTEECKLCLRRIVHPTGYKLTLGLSPSDPAVSRVTDKLRPSFREVVNGNLVTSLNRLRLPLHLIRTRLVVEADQAKVSDDSEVAAATRAIQSLADRMDRRLAHHEHKRGSSWQKTCSQTATSSPDHD